MFVMQTTFPSIVLQWLQIKNEANKNKFLKYIKLLLTCTILD